jgi:ATP/maltotriose-dependent transcriptional regulator MalT
VPDTVVDRPRLYALLDRTTLGPLTQLIAPAGTGKTVLASAWLHGSAAADSGRTATWLAAHDHPRLNAAVLEAVGGRSGDASDRAVLAAAQRRSGRPMEPPRLVVIDDAHLLRRTQVRFVSQVLATAPESVRLLVASRRDLALPVVDLALHGQATTLRGGQLRFNADETACLVHAHAATATPPQIATVVARTGGWAAAVVLAARSLLAAGPDDDGRLGHPDQPILDVLLGDAFGSLSEPAREVLLSTFSEATLTADRAVTLSGRRDAGTVLADLATTGLLVTAHGDGGQQLYRLHPLLVELLRRRAADVHDDGLAVASAHRRAALRAAETTQPQPALLHAQASGDAALLAQVLREQGLLQLSTGDPQVVVDAFDALPPATLDAHPELLGLAGLAHRTRGEPVGAGRHALRARASLDGGHDGWSDDALLMLQYDVASLDLWRSRFGWHDVDEAVTAARGLVGCAGATAPHQRHRPPAAPAPDRLAWLLVELAATEVQRGDLDDASAHLDEALVGARMLVPNRLVSTALSLLALIHYLRGSLHAAGEAAEAALAQRGGSDPLTRARAQVVLGMTEVERLDLVAARSWLDLARSCDDVDSDPAVAALRTLLHALLLSESGDLDAARRALGVEPVAAGSLPPYLRQYVAMVRWLCALLAGDELTATSQTSVLADIAAAPDVAALVAIADARFHRAGAREAVAAAVAAADTLHPAIRAAARSVHVVLLLRAGDHARARSQLDDLLGEVAVQRTLHALTIAASDSAFLDLLRDVSERGDGHPFAPAAYSALDRHRAAMPNSAMLGALVSDCPTPRRGRSASSGRPAGVSRGLPQPRGAARASGRPIEVRITARESEVLEQLALGGSYAEIGDALFITENTVKTHLASLYRKLGVEKRSAALRAARDRDLI